MRRTGAGRASGEVVWYVLTWSYCAWVWVSAATDRPEPTSADAASSSSAQQTQNPQNATDAIRIYAIHYTRHATDMHGALNLLQANRWFLLHDWQFIFLSLTTNNTHSKPIAHNEEAVINYMHQNHKKLIKYSTRHDCTATCHDVIR